MSAQTISLFTVALISAAVVTAALGALAVYHRTRGYFSFTLLMLALGWWASTYSMELTSRDLSTGLAWARLEYLAIVATPPLWFAYAWRYGGPDRRLSPRFIAALAVIPLLTLSMIFTNDRHGLIWATAVLKPAGDAQIIAVTYGSWFWLHTLYSYTLILIGSGLLLRAAWLAAPVYRAQSTFLVIAALVPLVGNLIYLIGLSPLPGLDLTPLLFIVSSILFSWASFSSRLLTIVPVARNRLIEEMGDGVIVLDNAGRVADINQAAQQIFATSVRAALAQPIDRVAPPLAALLVDCERNSPTLGELEFGAGETGRTFDMWRKPLFDRRERWTGCLIVLRDITERKRGEAELRAQKELFAGLAAVAQAAATRPTLRETLRGVLDVSSTLVGAEQGRILLLAEDVTIFESVATRGAASAEAARLAAGGALEDGPARWAAQQRDIVLVDDFADDARWPTPQGASGSAMAVPILERNHVLGVIILAHPERAFFQPDHVRLMRAVAVQIALAVRNAQMYETQRELAERAEAASRAKSAFLATMSHELRTPLNTIIGYGELIADELATLSQRDLVHQIGAINGAGRHLLGLVNDILDLSRIEAGQARLNLGPVDLGALVANVVAVARPLAAQNGDTLILECADDLGIIVTDLAKVQQILNHLVTNACKFTAHGRVTLRVNREAHEQHTRHEPAQPDAFRPSAMICFEIADTGIGMSEEQLGLVFAEFTQADGSSTRRHGGIGLGLTLSQRLCHLLGGTLTVVSTPGQGSTFTLRLPVATGEQAGQEGQAG